MPQARDALSCKGTEKGALFIKKGTSFSVSFISAGSGFLICIVTNFGTAFFGLIIFSVFIVAFHLQRPGHHAQYRDRNILVVFLSRIKKNCPRRSAYSYSLSASRRSSAAAADSSPCLQSYCLKNTISGFPLSPYCFVLATIFPPSRVETAT